MYSHLNEIPAWIDWPEHENSTWQVKGFLGLGLRIVIFHRIPFLFPENLKNHTLQKLDIHSTTKLGSVICDLRELGSLHRGEVSFHIQPSEAYLSRVRFYLFNKSLLVFRLF